MFSGWTFLPAAGLAAILLSTGAFFYGEHRADKACAGQQAQFQAQAEKAARIRQAKADRITLDAAVKEAQAQSQIHTRTVTITREIPVHVKELQSCVPYGLVRVWNAAANPGVDPAAIAPGVPDDACAPVSWRALAADIADDYGTGQANAEQLDALIQWQIDQRHANAPPRSIVPQSP